MRFDFVFLLVLIFAGLAYALTIGALGQ